MHRSESVHVSESDRKKQKHWSNCIWYIFKGNGIRWNGIYFPAQRRNVIKIQTIYLVPFFESAQIISSGKKIVMQNYKRFIRKMKKYGRSINMQMDVMWMVSFMSIWQTSQNSLTPNKTDTETKSTMNCCLGRYIISALTNVSLWWISKSRLMDETKQLIFISNISGKWSEVSE